MRKPPTTTEVNALVPTLSESRRDPLGWVLEVLVGQSHLKGSFDQIHAARSCAEPRTYQLLDLAAFFLIVPMDRT